MMNTKLIELARSVGKKLKANNLKLATAESCTAGGLGYYLTAISGSSDWVEGGFIVYSNQAKIQLLNVNPSTLLQFGAVSEQTVLELAHNCLKIAKVDLALAITGIAGPTGATPDKPLGTVWIGLADKQQVVAQHFVFSGDRGSVREQAIEAALLLINEK